MARNNAWSNYRLHEACAKLTTEDYMVARISFFPSIHLTLNHILQADRRYLDRLEGRDPDPDAHDEVFNFAKLRKRQATMDRALIAFCEALAPVDLDREIVIRRPYGVWPNPIGAILTHLFMHQIHHRGQVHAMLSGTPVPPPQLDEFFLSEDAEHRRKEMIAMGLPPD